LAQLSVRRSAWNFISLGRNPDKGRIIMGQADKQFCAFLRVVIRSLKKAIEEKDPAKQKELMKEILSDLQQSLED
jgi:hypothetical protein